MKMIKSLFFCVLSVFASASFAETTFNELGRSWEGTIDFTPSHNPKIERPSEPGQVLFFFRPLNVGSMASWAFNSEHIVSKILGEEPQIDGVIEVYYPQTMLSGLRDIKKSILDAFVKANLFEQLKNKKVILVGHSLGANVAVMMGKEFAKNFPTSVVSIAGAPLGYPSEYSGAAWWASWVTKAIPEMMPGEEWHTNVLSHKVADHKGLNITILCSTEGTSKTNALDVAQTQTLPALNAAVDAKNIEGHDRVNPAPSFEKIKAHYGEQGPDWIFFHANNVMDHMAMLDAPRVLTLLEETKAHKKEWCCQAAEAVALEKTEL